MNDYRPISCCNLIYKCISSILASRIKAILPNLINKAQSAFVPGRHISDNILLAQELLWNYHWSDTKPRCALKVDILKAYDSVRWSFLTTLLHKLRFPPRFIGWIHECITSPKFSVNINGELAGFFGSSRGLRQGDPLSSYLFVLVKDALSMLIQKRIEEEVVPFVYHWRCSKTKLTHLCFADDLLLFCGNSTTSMRTLFHILLEFSSMTGLTPNCSNSNIYIARNNQSFREVALDIFGFLEGELPVRYLGVPLISSKLNTSLIANHW